MLIMAALLVIAGLPIPGTGLIEGVYCSECQIHLMAVVANHLCEVIHICIIVVRRQVVLVAIDIATAASAALQVRGDRLLDIPCSCCVFGVLMSYCKQPVADNVQTWTDCVAALNIAITNDCAGLA